MAAENSIVIRKATVGAAFAPLVSEAHLIASVEIACLPGNAGPITFLGDDGSEVAWVPGEYHEFKSVDLSKISVKGTPGDALNIIGGTW